MDGQRIERILKRLAAARDDEDAWTALYARFRPFVYALAFRATGGSPDLAREAAQEVFFRLVKYCPFARLTDADELRAYLAVVTRNVVARLRVAPGAELQTGLLGSPEAELAEPVLTSHGEAVELRQLLARALGELQPEERRALALRLEGRSLQEVADRLGISAGNAAVRLHRIREKLRRNPALKDLI
jgi:RNA polymerase sigma-70 factor (ECF subfamily)